MGGADWVAPVVGAGIGLFAIHEFEEHQKKHHSNGKKRVARRKTSVSRKLRSVKSKVKHSVRRTRSKRSWVEDY